MKEETTTSIIEKWNLGVNWHDEIEERVPCLLVLVSARMQSTGAMRNNSEGIYTSFIMCSSQPNTPAHWQFRGQTHIAASSNIISHQTLHYNAQQKVGITTRHENYCSYENLNCSSLLKKKLLKMFLCTKKAKNFHHNICSQATHPHHCILRGTIIIHITTSQTTTLHYMVQQE